MTLNHARLMGRSDDNSIVARESARELSQFLRAQPEEARAHVRIDGSDIILPRSALVLLRDILAEMAKGNSVSVTPMHAELTTQQAADLLNVSRPYLIGLLERGKIPYTLTGTHRRIQAQALLDYKQRRKAESRKALEELAQQAQEEDMGY